MTEKVPSIVIGAGVIGCTVARALAEKGLPPWVLEKGPRIAEGVTSRNSGVIHAGIYYPPESLKAQTCVRGSQLLYEWCQEKSVPHRKCGKWIVGLASQESALDALLSNALRSGARGLTRASRAQIEEKIPQIHAEIAIFSPETGIVDPYLFSRSHQDAAESKDAVFLFECGVKSIAKTEKGYLVDTERGPVLSEIVINASGLYSDEIARLVGIDRYRLYPCRGDYYSLSSRIRLGTLIYPIKEKNAPGLGIHLTVGLDGRCKLGPDTEWVQSKEDFSAPAGEVKKQKFFEAARKYLKGLELDDIRYDTCGIRPKIRGPQDPEELDFIVSQDLPGFVNLIGIESPGLTASMALAEKVLQLL